MIQVLKKLASLKLTFVLMVGAGVIVLSSQILEFDTGNAVILPAALLSINLIAALMTSVRLASNLGLLGFHLALASLILLVAVDELTAFNGHVEVTEGTAFDPGQVETTRRGWLHSGALEKVSFQQGTFSIAYEPGMKRRDTVSQVSLYDAELKSWTSQSVGDDHPLVAAGYRFYTSFNKGLAPILSFRNSSGDVMTGSVHMPSYPLNYFDQANDWTVPGTDKILKLWLHLPEPIYDETEAWQFQIPTDATLIVMDGASRTELQWGETLSLGQGSLTFQEVRGWMGYTITYNRLTPWMLAAISVGIFFLSLYYIQQALLWRDRETSDAAPAGSEAS